MGFRDIQGRPESSLCVKNAHWTYWKLLILLKDVLVWWIWGRAPESAFITRPFISLWSRWFENHSSRNFLFSSKSLKQINKWWSVFAPQLRPGFLSHHQEGLGTHTLEEWVRQEVWVMQRLLAEREGMQQWSPEGSGPLNSPEGRRLPNMTEPYLV